MDVRKGKKQNNRKFFNFRGVNFDAIKEFRFRFLKNRFKMEVLISIST